jgi:hypothetical protein
MDFTDIKIRHIIKMKQRLKCLYHFKEVNLSALKWDKLREAKVKK